MYARVATAQDFHVHSYPKIHHSQTHSHAQKHANSQKEKAASATISLSSLHTYALYIYSRLRSSEEWREQFESLEMGVRLDVGVGTTRGLEKKRFFVNEITRFYGADYFSQHTLGTYFFGGDSFLLGTQSLSHKTYMLEQTGVL